MITFIQNDVVVGTTTSDASGFFTKELSALTPGINKINFSVTDFKNKKTKGVSYELNLLPQTNTRLSGLVLPPTIWVNKTTVGQDDSIRFSGTSVPNALVTLSSLKTKEQKVFMQILRETGQLA